MYLSTPKVRCGRWGFVSVYGAAAVPSEGWSSQDTLGTLPKVHGSSLVCTESGQWPPSNQARHLNWQFST